MTSEQLTKTGGSALAVADRGRLETRLGRLNRLARLMDEQFELPLIRYKIGLDPLIGLIPGGGDWATWVVSVYIFWQAVVLGAPRGLLLRMTGNLIVDLVTGYVPGVGDVVDAAFKANRRNVDLLNAHFGANERGELPVGEASEALVEARQKHRLGRYLLGGVIVLVLLALAAAPWVALWYAFGQG